VISSKNAPDLICALTDITLQLIFNVWWASKNTGSERPIAWNTSARAPSRQFHFPCGMEVTGSPGIRCIICHQDFRHPSQYMTSSMGTHLLATSYIAQLNELPETEVTKLTSTTVDQTAVAILKRQGSQGITLVSAQRNIRFDIQFVLY